ncbi:MAG TPA: hypothetical protein VLC46_22735 [Thermoanaerobaculia bacterium]|nr:hypothetical protein [Thermoanaerobaculia bacterium]
MRINEKNINPSVVTGLPQPAPAPEAVVDQLRAVQIGEVTPLTAAERRKLRRRNITSNPVLQASINVIGAHDLIEQAVGQPADDVRQMYDDANRWTAVEDELRTMLNGVSSANLIRRQRISLIAGRAYGIALQLARDPANAMLVPHVQEIRRLKSFSRRKKAARAPDASTSPAPDTPAPQEPER